MPAAADIVAQMISGLAITEPNLDTSIGTPARKILDVVAEQVAAAYVDQNLLQFVFDIDSKTGSALDDFCLLFGITRFQPKRATGLVSFSRTAAANQDYAIPSGTQVTTATGTPVVFNTTVPAVIAKGTTSSDVPVQAVVGGTSGNLDAATVTTLATPVDGVVSVTNASAITGGTDYESDSDLISRFKKTVFRSLAGTADMFTAVALEAADPTQQAVQVNVVGASQRWQEQVQIQSDRTATSTIPASNVKYIYANTSIFGPDIENGSILTNGVQYTFDTSVTPPVVRSIGTHLTPGDIMDLNFEYTSSASRNDPANGILNRVDVWVSGQNAKTATETTYFNTAVTFTSTAGATLDAAKFVRRDTLSTPATAGNYFIQLGFGPILTFPSQLTISGTTYHYGTDYWIVHDNSSFGYGRTSMFGIEWKAASALANGAQIVLASATSYDYNALPGEVEDRISRWRLVTTDVRAHAAAQVLLTLNFAIMLTSGYSETTTIADLNTALAQYLDGLGFDDALQASDIIQVGHEVPGIDNIRFLTSSEPVSGGSYGIEQVSPTGSHVAYFSTSGRAADEQLGDRQLPALYSINYVLKAANSWGVS